MKKTRLPAFSGRKWWLGAIVAALVLFAGAYAFAGGAAEPEEGITEPTTFQLAHVYAPDSVWNRGSELAAEIVAERTDGLIEIDIYPASQLGTEEEITEGAIFGSIDIVISGAGQIGNLFKPLFVAEMPYIFEDLDHIGRFAASDIGQQMFEDLREVHNVRVIGPTSFGIRHIISVDNPVETPDDLSGFTLRVPEQEVTIAYADAMGAEPTPIAYDEAYTALATGVADGLENPLEAFKTMRFYEVANYVNLTSHVSNLLLFLMNEDSFQRLNEEQQEIVLDAFAEASEYIVEGLKTADEELIDYFRDAGLEIIESDVEAFREQTAEMPVEWGAEWWADRYGADLHERIQEM